MVVAFQAAWLAQGPTLVGLEPNMLNLFPGVSGSGEGGAAGLPVGFFAPVSGQSPGLRRH